MNLKQHFLTKNDCYKAGKKITVKKLMLHSTGANNPKLSRYVDADELGTPSSSHWNTATPGGRQVCVHAFIGLDKKGGIATYQTLPWNYRGWHAGGSANDDHIGVEICEDDLKDADYFKAVYEEAVELFAYLCKKYDLTEKDIDTHSEGYKKGIASNHADVMHWFPKHGKSMDTFRADVKKELKGSTTTSTPVTPSVTPVVKPSVSDKSIDQLAKEVIAGDHGSGDARKKSLGSNYEAVQKRVNELLQPTKAKEKTVTQLAQEVLKGMHGTGRERMITLGTQYAAVQKEVNRLMKK